MQKALRIFLLILIIIGIGALATQKIWVPKLVNRILLSETPQQQVIQISNPIPNQSDKTDIIRLNTPLPNQTIQSPLVVTGEARGSWFFEASFPVILTNWDGLIIAQGVAQAKSDWTTTDFVPFEVNLTFTVDKKAYSNKGTLILKKDNPSGLPKNDNALEIPVIFAGVTANTIPKSGITGTVTLGPTCPVERIPPDPNCAPKFYSTSINIMRAGDNKIIKTIESDSNGAFGIDLDQGSYVLQTQGGNVLPRCPLVSVDVKSGQYVTANISCDTGIR
jgi:hypothetical protein